MQNDRSQAVERHLQDMPNHVDIPGFLRRQDRGPVAYAPPEVRGMPDNDFTNNTASPPFDAELAIRELAASMEAMSALRHIADRINDLRFGDLMDMATQLSKSKPDNTDQPWAIAQWLYEWAQKTVGEHNAPSSG